MEITTNYQQSPAALRPTRRVSSTVTLLGAVAAWALTVVTAHSQTFSVKDVGTVSGMSLATPIGMNDASQVIGTYGTGAESRAFRFEGAGYGGRKEIGDAGSRAFAINVDGLAAGDTLVKGDFNHAALFKDGLAADLGTLRGALFSRANGINNLQNVVGSSGSSLDGECARAFFWSTSSGMLDLGTLGGPYAQAMGINENNFITGTSQIKSRSIGATHAFVVQAPSPGRGFAVPMQDLGTLGGPSSYGIAINAANHVVGYSTLSAFDSRYHAFISDGGKMMDLGSLSPKSAGDDFSVAVAVNNLDEIVGYSFKPEVNGSVDPAVTKSNQAAFYYNSSTGMKDLNEMIGSASEKFHLVSATAINDKSQIVATAYDSNGELHALLLSPQATYENDGGGIVQVTR